jgi:hypothetical protein
MVVSTCIFYVDVYMVPRLSRPMAWIHLRRTESLLFHSDPRKDQGVGVPYAKWRWDSALAQCRNREPFDQVESWPDVIKRHG